MVSRAEAVRLLVIDDLGKEHRAASGFAENRFGALLRRRSKGLLATVITSNLNPVEFGEVYGTSTGELAKECMVPIQLRGSTNLRDVRASGLSKKLGV